MEKEGAAKECDQDPIFGERENGGSLRAFMVIMSSSILTNVAGSTGVRELWEKLEEKFNGLSRNNVMDLKRKLFSIKKIDAMEGYLDQIKEIVQKLNMANCHVEDEDLVFHTLNGLPDDAYKSLKQVIRTRSSTSILKFHEL